MDHERTRVSRHLDDLLDLQRATAAGRISRRRLTQGAAALGLSVPALGAALAGERRGGAT
jgi:hypothetical protein